MPDKYLDPAGMAATRQAEVALGVLGSQLQDIRNERTLAKAAVDGVVKVLGADAGCLILQPPQPRLYAMYREFSEDIARIEQEFHEEPERLCASLDGSMRAGSSLRGRVHLFPLIRNRAVVGFLGVDVAERDVTTAQEEQILSLCRKIAVNVGSDHQPRQVCGLEVAIHTTSTPQQELYDFIALENRCLGILAARVAAKGPAAQEFLRTTRAIVHFLAREYNSPVTIVAKLDTILHERHRAAHQRMFAMMYGVFDSASRLFRFASSGGIDPIIATATGSLTSSPERLQSATSSRPLQRVVQLNSGDLIICAANEQHLHPSQPFEGASLSELGREAATVISDDALATAKKVVSGFSVSTSLPPAELTLLLARVL